METIPQLPEDFEFSSDLVKCSKTHISFLRGLHRHGITLQRPSLKSLERYTDFWLPFVHKYQNDELVPPADIAWLWHCHRLAPFRYTAYIKAKFGSNTPNLEANPPFAFQFDIKTSTADEEALLHHTMQLWKQEYPNESFFFNLEETKEEKEEDDILVNGFDLLGSTDRQATFLWQVSGPRFTDDAFLEEGLVNYYKFLKLRNYTIKPITIVPTYQIDLFWHTHILSKVSGYYKDCKIIMGTTLNHDDSLNDRTEDGPLDTAFKATKAAWKEAYGETYNVEGGMYRGEPPRHYYNPSWKANAFHSKACAFETIVPFPVGPFVHVIGNHGSSSTNPGKVEVSPPPNNTNVRQIKQANNQGVAWTPLDGNAPDGQPAFMPAADKSTSYGVNANPFKMSYVFGSKAGNSGYYHVTTKEAYEILAARVSGKVDEQKAAIACVGCCTCGLGTTEMKKQLKDLEDLEKIAKARASEDVPIGDSHLPTDVNTNSGLRSKHVTSDGMWLFPSFYYNSAGGCGAGTVRKRMTL